MPTLTIDKVSQEAGEKSMKTETTQPPAELAAPPCSPALEIRLFGAQSWIVVPVGRPDSDFLAVRPSYLDAELALEGIRQANLELSGKGERGLAHEPIHRKIASGGTPSECRREIVRKVRPA